jgi:putative endonuclease
MSYCAYILYSSSTDRYYIGMTENLEQRIRQHNNPISRIKFTAKGIPWQLFIAIPCNCKEHALKLEKAIKAKKVVCLLKT